MKIAMMLPTQPSYLAWLGIVLVVGLGLSAANLAWSALDSSSTQEHLGMRTTLRLPLCFWRKLRIFGTMFTHIGGMAFAAVALILAIVDTLTLRTEFFFHQSSTVTHFVTVE